VTEKRNVKRLMLFFFGLCTASILFSGTRAAVVVLLFMLGWVYHRTVNLKIAIPLLALVTVIATQLPEDVRHRHFDLIFYWAEPVEKESDRTAARSAESRIAGLKDGWKLALKRPIFGYGPRTSAVARTEISEFTSRHLALHNLYGQLVAETGLIGGCLFLLMMFTYFQQLNRLNALLDGDQPRESILVNYVSLLQNAMLVMLLYGIFSHNLHHFHWVVLFAFQGAFVHILSGRDVNGLVGRAQARLALTKC